MSQNVVKPFAHVYDSISHTLNFAFPLVTENLIAKNSVGNTGTMTGRVGIERSNKNFELRVDTGLLLRVCSGQGKRANTFAVEAHILSERLGKSDLMAILDKQTNSVGVAVSRTRSEALVRHIEEGEEFLLLDNLGDGGPLFGGRINPGRVVCTRVQEDDCALGCGLATRLSAITE